MSEKWFWVDEFDEDIPADFGRMDSATLLSDMGECVLIYAEFDFDVSDSEIARYARLIAASPGQAAEIERLKAENKKHESGHTLMTQVIMIAELEAQNAALLRALKVVMPWASKAVADLEDSVIGKRALGVAWEAIENAKGDEAESQQ